MDIDTEQEFATLDEAAAYRERYLNSYPPQGYGTRVEIKQKEQSGKTVYVCHCRRWSSCD